MRRLLYLLALILLPTSFAQAGGFSIYETSVKANAMLGAFSAYADHVSTVYFNPAGLARLEGTHLSGGLTMIAPRSSFRGPLPYSNQKYEMADQNFPIPNLYASYQLREGLTAGIGVYVPFGLGTKWEEDWAGRAEAVETEVQTIVVNPSVGYTLPDLGIGKIHVGLGVKAVVSGDVKLSRYVEDFVPGDMFELDGSLDDPAFGFNAGLLYEPIRELRFGFTYRSGMATDYSGSANFNDLPTFAFPDGVQGSTSLDLPQNFVAAVHVKPTDKLSLEVDYVWWGWSSYDELLIEFDEPVPALVSEEFPEGRGLASKRGFEDTYQIRGGAEYRDFPIEGLHLMAGITYDKSPLPEKYVDPTLPDSDRLLFSGGFSYELTNTLTVDASYIFIRAKERKVTKSVNGLHGVYNTYAHLPGLGLTMNL